MRWFSVLILFLFLFPLVSAVELDIKESYSQGETIITKLSGNFLTNISKANIFFYRGHTKIPFYYDVAKIDNEYYIYVLLSGRSPDNYSISIENVRYMQGTQMSEEKIVKYFLIDENKTADFSINPGFVLTPKEFFLEIQNLQDKEITLSIKTDVTTSSSTREIFAYVNGANTKSASITLKSGETKDIQFKLGTGEKGMRKIEIKSASGGGGFLESIFSTGSLTYEIPIYISTSNMPSGQIPTNQSFPSNQSSSSNQSFPSNQSSSSNQSFPSNQSEQEPVYSPPNLVVEPTGFNVSGEIKTSIKRTIYLYNTGTEELNNITLSLSQSMKPFVNLSYYRIEKIPGDSNFPIDLYFSSKEEAEVEGHLKAKSEQLGVIKYSQIYLKFLTNYVPPVTPNKTQEEYEEQTCAELEGTICIQGEEECDKTLVEAKDNWCCFGTCEKIKKSNTGRIIGVAIVLVIIVVAIWFYKKKYKGTRKPIDLLKIAKGKKEFKP